MKTGGAVYDPLHPAVLMLIAHTLHSGEKSRHLVSVCGELAGDASLTRLLGMGLRTDASGTNSGSEEPRTQIEHRLWRRRCARCCVLRNRGKFANNWIAERRCAAESELTIIPVWRLTAALQRRFERISLRALNKCG